MTDLPPKFPDAWLPSAIVKTEKYDKGWELFWLENGEKVMIHHATSMIYRNIKDAEIQRWSKLNVD
jgi:hypothetical protein